MNAEIYLIVKKVFACGYTWGELERYFGQSKSFLEEKIKNYYKKTGEGADVKNAMLMEVINRNSMAR